MQLLLCISENQSRMPDHFGSDRGIVDSTPAPNLYRILCRVLGDKASEVEWARLEVADWERLVYLALQEGVGPLLYWELRRDWPAGAPQAFQDCLKGEFYNSAAHNQLISRELVRILQVLDAAQVPVIVLKGAALAASLYPDPALRPMGDLDLLVPIDGLPSAISAINLLGYRPEGPELWPGLSKWVACETNFDGGRMVPMHVELHWSLVGGQASRYRPEMAWFWGQARPWVNSTVRGASGNRSVALCLAPGAHLLYLAAHLALKHAGEQERLVWYYDLYRLATAPGEAVDWPAILDKARGFRWSAALRAALLGCVERFGWALPDGVIERLEAEAPLHERLYLQRRAARRSRWQAERVELETLRPLARLLLLLALLFPSPAYLRWRYRPRREWLWPFYYLLRWMDVLGEAVK